MRDAEKLILDDQLHRTIMAHIYRLQGWFRTQLARKRFIKTRQGIIKIQVKAFLTYQSIELYFLGRRSRSARARKTSTRVNGRAVHSDVLASLQAEKSLRANSRNDHRTASALQRNARAESVRGELTLFNETNTLFSQFQHRTGRLRRQVGHYSRHFSEALPNSALLPRVRVAVVPIGQRRRRQASANQLRHNYRRRLVEASAIERRRGIRVKIFLASLTRHFMLF